MASLASHLALHIHLPMSALRVGYHLLVTFLCVSGKLTLVLMLASALITKSSS